MDMKQIQKGYAYQLNLWLDSQEDKYRINPRYQNQTWKD